MSSIGTEPESLVSGGDAAPVVRDSPAGGDNPFVFFELNVVAPYESAWFALEGFPFTRMPELPGMILDDVPLDVLLLITADWRELHRILGFLRDIVTAYIYESMEALRGDAHPMYWIRAVIHVMEPPTPAAPVASMLKKVTYESSKKAEDEAGALPAEMVKETRCPICLDDYEDGEDVHLTPCGHPFHLVCLERSLRFKWKCPLCRTDMPR